MSFLVDYIFGCRSSTRRRLFFFSRPRWSYHRGNNVWKSRIARRGPRGSALAVYVDRPQYALPGRIYAIHNIIPLCYHYIHTYIYGHVSLLYRRQKTLRGRVEKKRRYNTYTTPTRGK